MEMENAGKKRENAGVSLGRTAGSFGRRLAGMTKRCFDSLIRLIVWTARLFWNGAWIFLAGCMGGTGLMFLFCLGVLAVLMVQGYPVAWSDTRLSGSDDEPVFCRRSGHDPSVEKAEKRTGSRFPMGGMGKPGRQNQSMKADAERKADSMRRIQKILLGTFLGGVLLCGVGAGTALVEYSSFTYAGEKKIGWEDLETKNLDFSFDRQKGSLIVDTGFWGRRVSDGIEADPAVPEGIIRYEVTYNKKRVEPFLEFYEFLEGPGAEDPGGERRTRQRKDGREPQGHLSSWPPARGGDLEIFMECKDEFLKEVKEKRISSYEPAYITEVRILVNPADMEAVEENR